MQHEELRQSLIDGCQNTTNHDTEEEDEAKATGSERNEIKQEKIDDETDEGDATFNEDLLCEHGGYWQRQDLAGHCCSVLKLK